MKTYEALPQTESQLEEWITPITGDYARTPIDEAFDWRDILGNLGGGYLVVFRSTLKPGADVERLAEHDRRAHEAAQRSPELRYYFADTADGHGDSVSWCLWADREAAAIISRDPEHRAAVGLTSEMYSFFNLERYYVELSADNEPIFTPVESGH